MPKCSVVGCNPKKWGQKRTLSLHRLPRSEVSRKKWLEAIGLENLRLNVKVVLICSLHFPETAFNRTLDVIRLRDDAIPLQLHKEQSTDEDDPDFMTETNQGQESIPDQSPLTDNQDPLYLHPVESEIAIDANDPVRVTSGVRKRTVPERSAPPLPSTLESAEQKRIQELERKCKYLRNKVKTLKGKVRRQKTKIDNFNNIVKNMLEKNLLNESIVILEVSEKR